MSISFPQNRRALKFKDITNDKFEENEVFWREKWKIKWLNHEQNGEKKRKKMCFDNKKNQDCQYFTKQRKVTKRRSCKVEYKKTFWKKNDIWISLSYLLGIFESQKNQDFL